LQKRDSAKFIYELAQASPSTGTDIKKSRMCKERLTLDQSLALMVDTMLSMHQYKT